MRIAVIDNYDSFTYNLVQALGVLGAELKVWRNDRVGISEISGFGPERIIISPGPGRPEKAGISCEVIKHFAGKIPLLGVCLGHQCLGFAYGGKVVSAKRIMHGKTSLIHHTGSGIFKGLSNPFRAMRYHSLALEQASLPGFFKVCAWAEDGEIMAIENQRLGLFGVQFHPESFLTEQGIWLLRNFLEWKNNEADH